MSTNGNAPSSHTNQSMVETSDGWSTYDPLMDFSTVTGKFRKIYFRINEKEMFQKESQTDGDIVIKYMQKGNQGRKQGKVGEVDPPLQLIKLQFPILNHHTQIKQY